MKQDIKSMWITALKSGRYKQAKKVMRSAKTGNYCCLGVLTNLYLKEHNLRPIDAGDLQKAIVVHSRGGITGTFSNSYPSTKVLKWAGLHHSTCPTLAELNDDKNKSFKEIADYIEKKY